MTAKAPKLNPERGKEPLVAQIQEMRDSPMPDSMRLQGLLHLTAELAKIVYQLKRRHYE